MPVIPTVPFLNDPALAEPSPRLKLASPAEVLAAVPYLLGFAPERSVVVMCLRGKQLGLTMRLDLDTPTEEMQEILLARLHGDGADTALIVLFDPEAVAGVRRPGSAKAKALLGGFRRAGIHVQDALGVRDGRFWSYLCREVSCCPPGGRPVPDPGAADHSKVAATFVAIGSAPLASRAELSATLAPITGERMTEMLGHLAIALNAPAPRPVELWWAVVSRYAKGPPRPGDELPLPEAAQLIVSLRDVLLRDEIISWSDGDAIVGILILMRELAPLALAPFNAQILATLGWAAYSSGDGALASMALERALAAEPSHNLARLLATSLEGGIDPQRLREVSGELSETIRTLDP